MLLYHLDSPSAWVTHHLSSSPSIQIPIAIKVGSAGTKNGMRKYVIDMLEASCRLGVNYYTISSLVQESWPTRSRVFNEALQPFAIDQSSHSWSSCSTISDSTSIRAKTLTIRALYHKLPKKHKVYDSGYILQSALIFGVSGNVIGLSSWRNDLMNPPRIWSSCQPEFEAIYCPNWCCQ